MEKNHQQPEILFKTTQWTSFFRLLYLASHSFYAQNASIIKLIIDRKKRQRWKRNAGLRTVSVFVKEKRRDEQTREIQREEQVHNTTKSVIIPTSSTVIVWRCSHTHTNSLISLPSRNGQRCEKLTIDIASTHSTHTTVRLWQKWAFYCASNSIANAAFICIATSFLGALWNW